MSDNVLFSPFTLKGLTLPNRIVMAPMTRGMAPEGIPGQPNADYYRRRAEGEAGLILTEGTVVDRPASRNMPGIPFFHGEQALAGWKQVAEAVHAVEGYTEALDHEVRSDGIRASVIEPAYTRTQFETNNVPPAGDQKDCQ